jgi:hypothetical protein
MFGIIYWLSFIAAAVLVAAALRRKKRTINRRRLEDEFSQKLLELSGDGPPITFNTGPRSVAFCLSACLEQGIFVTTREGRKIAVKWTLRCDASNEQQAVDGIIEELTGMAKGQVNPSLWKEARALLLQKSDRLFVPFSIPETKDLSERVGIQAKPVEIGKTLAYLMAEDS